jgi:putative transposase
VCADRHLKRMEEIMRSVCADVEAELVEFTGEANQVHLLVNFPPKVAISKLVNSLKGVSSRRLRQEFPDLVHHYRRAQHLWSGSYSALAGLPARAFTTALNGALACVSVARGAASRQNAAPAARDVGQRM